MADTIIMEKVSTPRTQLHSFISSLVESVSDKKANKENQRNLKLRLRVFLRQYWKKNTGLKFTELFY